MGMVQYMSMDRRFFYKLGATLLDRTLCSSAGKFGLKATLGGSVGMDPERFDEAQPHHPVGREPDRLEPAPVVARAGGEAPRREDRGDRSLPQPVGGEMHAAHRAPAGHRRRARARHDACADRRGPDRSRLHREVHAGVRRSSRNASSNTRPNGRRAPAASRSRKWCSSRASTARTKPAAIRLNYGMQRHAGGGIAARTIACLPALTGAWREAAGGIVLTTADFYKFDHAGARAARSARRAPAARHQPHRRSATRSPRRIRR